jgi:1,4-alpha-glucan branching enzyme
VFCSDLAAAVTRGRREEFAAFEPFGDETDDDRVPDPNAEATFAVSRLAWHDLATDSGAAWHAFYRHCLSLRRRLIVPAIDRLRSGGTCTVERASVLRVHWPLDDATILHLLANLSAQRVDGVAFPAGDLVFVTDDGIDAGGADGALPPWTVVFTLEDL